MIGTENILLFLSTGILLNLYPGPDTLYIVGRSVSQGRLAGISASLGISSGSVVHIILGALGLSAIVTTSAKAFMFVKIAGAGYLIYQGVMMLLKRRSSIGDGIEEIDKADCIKIYRQGVVTNILNPKVAVFFMAFLPQFISPDSPNKGLSFVFLGLIFLTTGTIWCLLVAVFSSAISNKLRASTKTSNCLLKINGLLFTYLGLKLATATMKN
jgi:threonine/homoserine/homoserine lactone efflux protein